MVIERVSRRDRKALLWGATALATLLFLSRGVPRLSRWQQQTRESATELMQEVWRVQSSIEALPEMLDSLEARNARFVALAPRLVPGGTSAGVSGALAAWVSQAAINSGTRLGAVYVSADTALTGVFSRVTVRGDLVGDVTGLSGFLLTLERGPFLLAVRDLSVDQTAPGSPDDRPEVLRVQFAVQGLALLRRQERGGP